MAPTCACLDSALTNTGGGLQSCKGNLMRTIARKAITATLTIAATAAFGLGASSEAWGGKSSEWDRIGVFKSSEWD